MIGLKFEKVINVTTPKKTNKQMNIISFDRRFGIKNFVSKENSHESALPAKIDATAEKETALYIGFKFLKSKNGKNLKFGVCQLLRNIIRRV